MSHELRTPLNAIMGFSEIIADEVMGPIGQRRYIGYAADILSSARHLLDIISGVLDMSKAQAGKLDLVREPVALGRILDDCAVMVRDQCARADLRLDIIRPDRAAVVDGEPAKLRQIVVNLLANAIKFTEPGGAVWLQVRSGAVAEISVGDTGIGMTAEEVHIAMTPFGQVESWLARRHSGTGLGLPLTKALVELHGGSMAIDSTPGKGTVVTVTLPLAETVVAADPPPAMASAL
jgi:signal transduction histidine kinase